MGQKLAQVLSTHIPVMDGLPKNPGFGFPGQKSGIRNDLVFD